MTSAGRRQVSGSGFGNPRGAALARRDKSGHRANGLFDWNIGIDAVLVEKIDGVDSEPGQAGVASAADILRRTIQTSAAVGSDAESEFCGNDDFFARDFA